MPDNFGIGTKCTPWIKNSLIFLVIACFLFNMTSCNTSETSKSIQAPELIKTQKPKYILYEVKRKSFAKTAIIYGKVTSARQQDLYFKVKSGRLKAMYAMLGESVKAGQLLAELESDDLEIEIERQELKVKKAQLAYQESSTLNLNNYDIEIAALELEMEKSELDYLKEQLMNRRLVSTMDGLITSCVNYKTGEMLAGYTTLYSVADPTKLHIECTSKGVDLSVGMKVEIGYKSKSYPGVITSETIVKQIPNTMDMVRYYTYVKFDKQPEGLEIGENLSVTVELIKKDNVLVVPKKAIHTFNGQKYLMVMDNEEIVERYVETGIETELEVEIVNGLKEGESVITN